MNRVLIQLIAVAALAGLGSSVYLLLAVPAADPAPRRVVLLSTELARGPLEGSDLEHGGGLTEQFERRTGVRVQVHYLDATTNFHETQACLVLTAEPAVLDALGAAGAAPRHEVARLAPVLMLGSSASATSIAEVRTPSRLAVAEDGDLARVAADLWPADHAPPELITLPSRAAADAVARGRVDAAVVWAVHARAHPHHETLPLDAVPAQGPPLVVVRRREADDARRFAAFLAGEVAAAAFARYGFEVADRP